MFNIHIKYHKKIKLILKIESINICLFLKNNNINN